MSSKIGNTRDRQDASAKKLRAILHPTDFSEQSEIAFAHALRLAVENHARLYIFHVRPGSREDIPWHEYPSVRATLERWGLLEPNSSRAAVGELGIVVEKLVGNHKNIVKSIVGFHNRKPVDLIVLATEGRRGLLSWRPSIAEPVARLAGVPTLFVPRQARSCVDWHDGRVSMQRVLVPVAHNPRAHIAVARAASLLESFGTSDSVLTVLHVGDEKSFPKVALPADTEFQLEQITEQGSAVRRILAHARAHDTDLILMATEGRQGLADAMWGSTTEQVIRRAPCPVLAVPRSAGVD